MRCLASLARGCVRRPFAAPAAGAFAKTPNALCCRAKSSTAEATYTPSASAIVEGSTAAGIRDCEPYVYERSEFIGKMFPMRRTRADAGDVLAFLDICTGRAAVGFLLDEKKMIGGFRAGHGKSLATISFNAFTFTQPVYEGDLIYCDSAVVFTGSTAVGVHSVIRRQAYDCTVPSFVGEAFVTLVVVNEHDVTKVLPNVTPAVRISAPELIESHDKYLRIRKANAEKKKVVQRQNETGGKFLTRELVETEVNKQKSEKVRIADTAITAFRKFQVDELNENKVIFGGDILRFMERAALHTARVFARKPRLYTLAMLGMNFYAPMQLGQLARCRATVPYVRKSSLLVRVRITAEDHNGVRLTNEASFVILALDEDGKPTEIDRGIELDGAEPEDLLEYYQAHVLMDDSAKDRPQTKTGTFAGKYVS